MGGYPIPKASVRRKYEVSNSRFIATLGRAETAAAAKDFIAEIRAEMPDASHHVYAFIAGYGASKTEGMSDDGEPAGTSGPPALAVLRGSGLGDAVLVITRYFGGTKLGAGGLVSAYKAASKMAVEAVQREEQIARTTAGLSLTYSQFHAFQQFLKDYPAILLNEDFSDSVRLQVAFPVEFLPELEAWAADREISIE